MPRARTLNAPLPTRPAADRPDSRRRHWLGGAGASALAIAAAAAGWGAATAWRNRWPADAPGSWPALDYPVIDGRRLGPQQLRGQVTLVNFWATSCTICVAEMPDLVQLHQRFHARGFEILAIAMPWDRPDQVLAFNARHALPFPVALDPLGEAVRSWGGVDGTPLSWLVDRQGQVRERWLGRLPLRAARSAIEKLL